jgi:hypothetical protein
VPPTEIHNLELIADPDMLGNDTHSDCVAAGIENNKRACRAALGLPLNKLTAAQVLANYYKMTGGPDSGLVEQLALEWVQKHGWGTDKLLCFAGVVPKITPIDETVSEFHSGLFGLEIDTAQEYPATVWDDIPLGPKNKKLGGHGTAAGTYNPELTFCKTWGYLAQMTPSYVGAKVGEFWVLVWDFMWKSLTYARQVQLVADYETLTEKAWTGPAPVAVPTITTVKFPALRTFHVRKGQVLRGWDVTKPGKPLGPSYAWPYDSTGQADAQETITWPQTPAPMPNGVFLHVSASVLTGAYKNLLIRLSEVTLD